MVVTHLLKINSGAGEAAAATGYDETGIPRPVADSSMGRNGLFQYIVGLSCFTGSFSPAWFSSMRINGSGLAKVIKKFIFGNILRKENEKKMNNRPLGLGGASRVNF